MNYEESVTIELFYDFFQSKINFVDIVKLRILSLLWVIKKQKFCFKHKFYHIIYCKKL